jgi:hypothetical protein
MLQEAEQYKKILHENMVIDDWEGVDIFLAAVATHWVVGNMLWFRIIGASGSGKSELLRSLESPCNKDYVISADTFTPGAIRGGYMKDSPRMLDLWNNKLVVTKDFASMVTKKKEDKAEVFGLMRSAYDGTLSAFYGSDDSHVKLEFHFDWILASTPYIERQRSLEAELGSRFIDLRWRTPRDEVSAVVSAMEGDATSSKFRDTLGQQMHQLLIATQSITPAEIDLSWLASIARVAARLRTPVYRDIKHEIYDIPTPEVATRYGQGLQRIAKGLSVIGITNYKPYIKRLALDCLSNLRREIVTTYMADPTETLDAISKKIKANYDTCRYEVENMKMLGWNKEMWEILNG